MDKEQLYNIAKTYVGYAHINGAMVKGNKGAFDCCTLPASIFTEMGYKGIDITFGYSGIWYLEKGCKEILLPYLEKHCYPVDSLEVGDVISYEWGRAKYAHLAVYLGDGLVIHCQSDVGVEITEIENPYFYKANGHSRVSGYWRLKEVKE